MLKDLSILKIETTESCNVAIVIFDTTVVAVQLFKQWAYKYFYINTNVELRGWLGWPVLHAVLVEG